MQRSRNEPLHKILETRCLPIMMPNRPGNYENPRPELGLELKERLTAWRAKHLFTTFADIEPIDGISGRLWDITKPLFFVNALLPVDFHILEESILAIAGEKDESRKDTVEGRLVAIIKEITSEYALDRCEEWSVKTGEIRRRYNEGKPEDRHASSPWIGKRLKSMSFRNRIVHGYSEIMLTSKEYATILKQYGQNGRESSKPTNPLPPTTEQDQHVMREVESGRESARGQPDFKCPEEREFYHETLQALRDEGGKTEGEIELLLQKALEDWRRYDE